MIEGKVISIRSGLHSSSFVEEKNLVSLLVETPEGAKIFVGLPQLALVGFDVRFSNDSVSFQVMGSKTQIRLEILSGPLGGQIYNHVKYYNT